MEVCENIFHYLRFHYNLLKNIFNKNSSYSRRRSRAAELTNEIPNYNQHYLTHNMPAKVNRAIL